MARKKEYDKEEILNLATELFWSKGFKATSISDLVKATGLNKHSMYEEFKSKEGLFKEALLTYVTKLQKENHGYLQQEPLGLENIKKHLLYWIGYNSCDDAKGCMIVNCLVEKESLDAETFSYVQVLLDAYETQILKCLQAAQQKGEIPANKDVNVLAKYVSTFSRGISLNGKQEQDKEQTLKMLDILMQSLQN